MKRKVLSVILMLCLCLSMLAGCGENSGAANAENTSEPQTSASDNEVRDAQKNDTAKENIPGTADETAVSEPEKNNEAEKENEAAAEPEADPDRERLVELSRAALNELKEAYVLPGGIDVGYDDYTDFSENKFAVADFDGDGKDELIVSYTTTYVAGMIFAVYRYDGETDSLAEEFTGFPDITAFDNGIVKAGLSHNQGKAGDSFWPYNIYRYNAETDSYDIIALVDAWDKAFVSEDYPSAIDVSGTGIVYYIYEGGLYNADTEPVDSAAYESWYNGLINGAAEIAFGLMPITQENIDALK